MKAPKPEPTAEAVAAATGKHEIKSTVPRGYKVGRRMTSPLLLLSAEKSLSFIVDGDITEQEGKVAAKDGGKPMAIVPITRMDTGEEANLVVPTVVESALRRTPGGYVGKAYLVEFQGKRNGKRYNDYEVYELEDG